MFALLNYFCGFLGCFVEFIYFCLLGREGLLRLLGSKSGTLGTLRTFEWNNWDFGGVRVGH